MAEDTKKTPAKKAAPKKTATEKKAAAPKTDTKSDAKTTAPAKKAPAKKSEPKAKKSSGNMITVRQIGSPIGRPEKQRKTLIGLGLNKMHKTRELEDTAAVRGMVKSIPHLVEIVEEAA